MRSQCVTWLRGNLIYIALFCFVVADGIITNMVLSQDLGYEANTLMQPFAGSLKLILLKIVGALAAIALLLRISKKKPKLAYYTAFTFMVIYGLIVAWNSSVYAMTV